MKNSLAVDTALNLSNEFFDITSLFFLDDATLSLNVVLLPCLLIFLNPQSPTHIKIHFKYVLGCICHCRFVDCACASSQINLASCCLALKKLVSVPIQWDILLVNLFNELESVSQIRNYEICESDSGTQLRSFEKTGVIFCGGTNKLLTLIFQECTPSLWGNAVLVLNVF